MTVSAGTFGEFEEQQILGGKPLVVEVDLATGFDSAKYAPVEVDSSSMGKELEQRYHIHIVFVCIDDLYVAVIRYDTNRSSSCGSFGRRSPSRFDYRHR